MSKKKLKNPYGEVWAYIRVSTKEQNLDRQYDAILDYGVDETHIFADQISGKNFNRPAYKKLIRILRKGDIVVIKSIDRLGRNYTEIIDQFKIITQDIGCGIHVIDMPTLNTSGDPDDLINKFTKDMTLQVLSFVAQNERENTLKRQREGIEAAKRRKNVKIGRPKTKMPFDFWMIYILWRTKEYQTQDLLKYCNEVWGTSTRTFYRRICELDARYSCIKADRLYDLILDEEWYDGISYDYERLQSGIGQYNPYTLRKPTKKKKTNDSDELSDEDIELKEQKMKRAILERRRQDFQEHFHIKNTNDLYSDTIDQAALSSALSKQLKSEQELPKKLIYKTVKKTETEAYYNESGIQDAVSLIEDATKIPNIEIDPQAPVKTVIIV